jgi:hypothetical protein
MTVKVKAMARGFYGKLREPGEEFVVQSKDEIGSWMEGPKAPRGEKAAPKKD